MNFTLLNKPVNWNALSQSIIIFRQQKLMSRAGKAALDCIKCHWPQAERILVVCGTGNNGGDGFELARQAIAEEYRVSIFQVGDEKEMSEETLSAREGNYCERC